MADGRGSEDVNANIAQAKLKTVAIEYLKRGVHTFTIQTQFLKSLIRPVMMCDMQAMLWVLDSKKD